MVVETPRVRNAIETRRTREMAAWRPARQRAAMAPLQRSVLRWHYSQALVEAYSQADCSDGEQYALSSSTDTHETFCSHVKTIGVSSRSRSGMTCGRLMDAHGEALLTWFQEDSRVRMFPQPVEAQESKARSQDSGQSWRESFAKYDHATHSLKTVQCSLLEDSTAFSATLPRWGSMQSGELSERTIPAHLTNVIVSGSLLPTPTASSYGTNQGGGMGRTGKVRPSLQTMARKNLWPTPTAHNAKETNARSETTRNTPTLAAQVGGKLNPTWVEWLMGWPLGWTDLSASATDKFQAWLHSHGAR